jgi:hypothetical protein
MQANSRDGVTGITAFERKVGCLLCGVTVALTRIYPASNRVTNTTNGRLKRPKMLQRFALRMEFAERFTITVRILPGMPHVYPSCRDQYGGHHGTRSPLNFPNRELFGSSIGP